MDIFSIIRSFTLTLISGIVRTLLVAGLTWLATRGLIDRSTSHQLTVIGPIAFASIAWSLIEKYVIAKFHLERLNTALNLPAGSSVADLEEELRKAKTDDAPK